MSVISKGRIELRAYPDAATLARETANALAVYLTETLEQKSRVTLVVPGGTTPGRLFDALSLSPIDWRRIGVTLSDERWVDVSDLASNQRQARLRLLCGKAAAAEFVSWRGAGPDLATAARTLDASLQSWMPFDVCILGLGADGHLASLIPGAEGFDVAMQDDGLVRPVRAPGAAGASDRLTLTFSAIAASKLVVLVFTGAAKRVVFDCAVEGEGAAPIVKLLHEAQCPVWACWAPE